MSKFDVTKLGKMTNITVKDSNGEFVELPYNALKLVVVSGQLCFSHEDELIMPIARQSTINKLFSNEE